LSFHRNATGNSVHGPFRQVFADAAARTGDATTYVAAQSSAGGSNPVYALQLDTGAVYYLSNDSPTTWTAVAGGGGGGTPKATLQWGNNSISSTTSTRYLTPGYQDAIAPTTVVQFRLPFACTLKNLRIRQVGAGNGNNVVFTLRLNGAGTALAVTLASTGTDGGPDTDSVSGAAGDLIDIEVTKAASVGTSPSDVTAIVEMDAT
jgi:hypothetical protein